MSLITTIAPCPSDAAKLSLAQFLLGHAEAVVAAAALLGGQPAERRTARLIEKFVDAPRLSSRLRQEFVELHRLLALELVNDLDDPEAVCFAEINPASSAVEEICLLTDELRSHLLVLAQAKLGEPLWEDFVAAA